MNTAVPTRRSVGPASRTSVPSRKHRRGSLRPRAATLGLLVSLLSTIPTPTLGEEPFKVGFASNLLVDVNENDARASMKAWGQSVAKELHIPLGPEPVLLRDRDHAWRAFRNKEVDAAGLTTPDFDVVRRQVEFDPILVTRVGQQVTERYLLLVHRNGPVKSLADLRDRRLIVHAVSRTCLAPLWLDTRLLECGLAPISRITSHRTEVTKLAKAVLPVFFQKAEACLVTQNGFATMAELNPQVGKELRVLECSPELLPVVFVLRADFNPSYRDRLIQGVKDLDQSPAGRQILTVFQGEDMVDAPSAYLEATLALIGAQARGQTDPTDTHGTPAATMGVGASP